MNAAAPRPLIAVHGTTVRALDTASGRLLWSYDATLVVSRYAFLADRVFALDDHCRIHCLDITSGAVLGVVATDAPERSACALLVDDDQLYVATTRSVIALDAQGRERWRTAVGGSHTTRAGLGLPGNAVQPDFYAG